MNNRSRGFTLMELMIVVALVGVILAIGAPSFGEFRRSNRMAGIANDFLVAVQVARSEALKRQTGVSMCPSDTPEADDAVCTDDLSFNGWIVFADPNNNCQREPADAREVILQIGTRVDTSPSRPITSVADGNCIGFAGTGFTRQTPGPGPEIITARHTLFCDDRGDAPQPGTELSSSRGVDLSPTGRARITRLMKDGKLDGFDIACGGA
jgi:type IV fimbrial biogenesis protein FimT